MKRIGLEEAVKELKKYCAYQERCHSEVMLKSKSLGLNYYECNEALVILIQNNFLNEERFALLYARSKMNQKKWGPIKISIALKQKLISPGLIKKAINNLDPKDIEANLHALFKKYQKTLKSPSSKHEKAQKTVNYLIQKGYTYDLVKRLFD